MNFIDFLLKDNNSKPEKLFLLGREELSYDEIANKVATLSEHLTGVIGMGKNILLCSPNNIFFIISYLSIIKSGNVCIPIDPSLSPDNLNYIIKETSPSIIFNSAISRIDIKILGQIAIIDEDFITDLLSKKYLVLDYHENFDSNNLAEIIFTSGSTGKPKGVMLSHRNLIANTKSIIEYLMLSEKDRMLVVIPFYYCYGLSLLHTHLKCGGSIVINSSFIFLGGVINDLLKYNCTGFAGVPTHFQILLRKTKTFVTTKFPDLRYVTQAGGKLHNIFIEEFINAFPTIKFYTMYGQTEATARLSYLPPEMLPNKLGSIGKGIPGVYLRVVNENNQEVLTGETGEIIVQGDNIMLGYYKDAQLTNATLVDGMLKTGDLATVDTDGFIYLVARKKEILKIRGKRVSPKEIEKVILGIPYVVDCSIEGYDDIILGEAMKAIVVINKDYQNGVKEDDILQICTQELEAYKVPSKIEISFEIKMNNSGKKVKNN